MATTIIGLGYVGLTLSLKLASMGETVHAVEKKPEVVKSLLSGVPHINEPGLEEHLRKSIGSKFFPSTGYPGKGSCSTHILCVNTPVDAEGHPDLQPLIKAARELSSHISEEDMVLLRSTVPPGTAREIVAKMLEKGSGLKCGENLHLCVAPERTVEGNAFEELGRLPQIVGGINEDSSKKAYEFFSKITPKVKIVSSMEAAEITKLMDNSYRYAIFALGNELGLTCESLGLDSREVIRAANWEYPRNDIKLPGAGVGGGCLPKDSSILMDAMIKAGLKPRIMAAAKEINDRMPERIFDKVVKFHKKHHIDPGDSKILILGFAFKGRPEVNDTRHSPGGHLCRMLDRRGYDVFGFDPIVNPEQIASYGAHVCQTAEEGFSNATCVIAMNDNSRWNQLDLEKLSSMLTNSSIVIDGWDVLERGKISKENVYFWRLGDGREAEGR